MDRNTLNNDFMRWSGNPILPGRGVCDPHIRVYGNRAYLYATHDKCPANTKFEMNDWWIWSTPDLVSWSLEATVRPDQTYHGKPCKDCWAVDAIEREGKHYLYFSLGPTEIGVLQGESPVGPWHDPLGKPLVAEGSVATEARDPGLFRDDDGEYYIVFGTWSFFIARMNRDMVSMAENPKPLLIRNPEGPYGPGRTDDKPYLHKRAGIYYLSWGCYYGMSEKLYGPYQCQGSIIQRENICTALQDPGDCGIDHDRHGSFFEWDGQWYFICNEKGLTRSEWFRDSSICYVDYTPGGRILPVQITEEGVAGKKLLG